MSRTTDRSPAGCSTSAAAAVVVERRATGGGGVDRRGERCSRVERVRGSSETGIGRPRLPRRRASARRRLREALAYIPWRPPTPPTACATTSEHLPSHAHVCHGPGTATATTRRALRMTFTRAPPLRAEVGTRSSTAWNSPKAVERGRDRRRRLHPLDVHVVPDDPLDLARERRLLARQVPGVDLGDRLAGDDVGLVPGPDHRRSGRVARPDRDDLADEPQRLERRSRSAPTPSRSRPVWVAAVAGDAAVAGSGAPGARARRACPRTRGPVERGGVGLARAGGQVDRNRDPPRDTSADREERPLPLRLGSRRHPIVNAGRVPPTRRTRPTCS